MWLWHSYGTLLRNGYLVHYVLSGRGIYQTWGNPWIYTWIGMQRIPVYVTDMSASLRRTSFRIKNRWREKPGPLMPEPLLSPQAVQGRHGYIHPGGIRTAKEFMKHLSAKSGLFGVMAAKNWNLDLNYRSSYDNKLLRNLWIKTA